MLIGELADAAGVPTRTVRFYERRGLLPPPRRTPNGYRVYDDTILRLLRFIRSTQAAGLTLAEILSIIEIRDSGDSPCAHVDALLADKLREVRERREQLLVLEADLCELVERSRSLDPADCTVGAICHILGSRTGSGTR